MADPFTWVAIASAVVGAGSAVYSGQQQQQQAEAESIRMRQAADVALRDATAQDEQFRTDIRRRIGSQIAASAEAGAGLNADSLRESIYGAEMDSAAIRYGALSREQALNDQANIRSWEGKGAKTAGYLNAASSLLNSGSSYYSRKKR